MLGLSVGVQQIATGSGMPKLYRFAKSELPKDPEAQDADGAYLRACTQLRGWSHRPGLLAQTDPL